MTTKYSMNVLILTPDAVGSTLLQRVLTIYMQMHDFDRPVINLHEITNGLAKFYSPDFQQEIVSKKTVREWGYYQSLSEIVDMLDSVTHYKTSRLAHYHLIARKDTAEQLLPFYNYLNENFYIIACTRTNVFEHALSMTFNKIHKKLNVYSADEKICAFYDLYRSGVELDPSVFLHQLDRYKHYTEWSRLHFQVARYFNYETDVPNLERFILDLPVFLSQAQRISWQSQFGISWNQYNRLTYAATDMAHPALTQGERIPLLSDGVYNSKAVTQIQTQIKTNWNRNIQQTFFRHAAAFQKVQTTIERMIELGVIVNGPPIKKQTLDDKKKIIRNFTSLQDLYNRWAEKNPQAALECSDQYITQTSDQERDWWRSFKSQEPEPHILPPNQL